MLEQRRKEKNPEENQKEPMKTEEINKENRRNPKKNKRKKEKNGKAIEKQKKIIETVETQEKKRGNVYKNTKIPMKTVKKAVQREKESQ